MRAGIWARSVCINEGLELGSMLPIIDVCRDANIPVLVMNPNYNKDPETQVTIPHNSTMAEHAVFVWKNYVEPSGFDKISIIAHSAGGGCLSEIIRVFPETFFTKVHKIAYTDSFVIPRNRLTFKQKVFMFGNAVHYAKSDKPLGTILASDSNKNTCPIVSAGHPRHEYTTGTSQYEIMGLFGYLDKREAAVNGDKNAKK